MKKKNLYFLIGIISGLLLGFAGTFFVMNILDKDNINTSTKEEKKVAEDVFLTESLYCDLYYPKQWEDKVIIEEALNVVHFSANFGEEKVVDLFDVVASEISEDDKSGELEVHIIVYELELDDQWSNEEKQTIVKMQEDVSCIASYLEKEGITVIK